MSSRVKVLIVLLTLVVVVTGILPQMAEAHRQDESTSQQREALASELVKKLARCIDMQGGMEDNSGDCC